MEAANIQLNNNMLALDQLRLVGYCLDPRRMPEDNGDCPKRVAPQLHDRCDLICPDLPKVL